MIVTVSRSMISNAKREDKAKNRPIVLDEYITIEYIDNMYIAQEGLCDHRYHKNRKQTALCV